MAISDKRIGKTFVIRYRSLAVLLFAISYSLFAVSLAGCGVDWKRKFIRKRKDLRPPQAILTLEPDHKAVLPAPDRYREHYAFWKSWHSELLASYGQIRKRDRAYLSGAIGELEGMQAILAGEPATRLTGILKELRETERAWAQAPPSWHPPTAVRTRLQQMERQIAKEFHYSRVKSFIPPDAEQPQPSS